MRLIFNPFTGNFDFVGSGGGSSGSLLSETPSGAINGSNTVFTVVHTPAFLQLNGMIQTAGGTDYTLSGTGPFTITYVLAPQTNSVHRSYYQ